ncbi:hypothetical protein Tco_0491692 [Tanacetum coccineum]
METTMIGPPMTILVIVAWCSGGSIRWCSGGLNGDDLNGGDWAVKRKERPPSFSPRPSMEFMELDVLSVAGSPGTMVSKDIGAYLLLFELNVNGEYSQPVNIGLIMKPMVDRLGEPYDSPEKVVHSRISDARVWKRAHDYLGLMNEPAICFSVLGLSGPLSGPTQKPGTINWSEGKTKMIANIPFYILARQEEAGPAAAMVSSSFERQRIGTYMNPLEGKEFRARGTVEKEERNYREEKNAYTVEESELK